MLRPLLLLTLAPLLAAQESAPAAASPASTPAEPAEQILLPPEPGRFKLLFQRFRTEHAALSPDGRLVAYTVRTGEETSVVIFDVESPGTIKTRVQAITDEQATPMLSAEQRERTPGRGRWLRWATPTRLVIETNRVHTRTQGEQWASLTGAVLAVDADGANFRELLSPEDVTELTAPAGQFSNRRNNPATFRGGQVWTPDQPLGPTGLAPNPFWMPADDTVEPTDPLQPDAAEPFALGTGAEIQARNLRVFDLDPRQPGAVTIISTGPTRGNGTRSVGFHSLDATTGKLADLSDHLLPAERSPLLDRQGVPRVALPNTTLSSFPFVYEYFGARGRNRPHPLGEVTGLPGFTLAPDNFFGERAIPLGFDEDPNVLYFASNLGRDTFGVYSLDLTTKQRGAITLENPTHDLVAVPTAGFGDGTDLIFDRFTHHLAGLRYQAVLRTTTWLRPEWRTVQAELEQALPGRCVDLLDWDEAGRRFLVSTEGPADPGAFYLYDREQGRLLEFVRRAPWIDEHHVHATLPFGFTLTNGSRITGLITVPAQPRMKPMPMVVLCPDQPWLRVSPDFQTEVSALATMGFAVVQLNGRGAWGLGLKQRQSLTAGYDLIQVEDIATTLDALGQLYKVNSRRVAIMGRGHGAFIALRAVQAYPDRFRCAVALEPIVDLGDWLATMRWDDEDVFPQLTRRWLGDDARLKAAPLTRDPAGIKKPVLLLSYPGVPGQPRRPVYLAARRFAEDVQRPGTTATLVELPLDYVRGLPGARAEVFDHIEGFLNEHIYDYKVKLRDLKILPDKK